MPTRYQRGLFRNDTYRAGNAYFTCDRCSGRYRRSLMITEWDGLKVDAKCIDPRPPQMVPPNIYPEGMPFFDARPPQDNGDRLQDNTYLNPMVGGVGLSGDNGQGPGAISPQAVIESPTPQGPNVLEDDITIITGEQHAPTAD